MNFDNRIGKSGEEVRSRPVGTGGGGEEGMGPCACPGGERRDAGKHEANASHVNMDRHKAPSSPQLLPMSLQDAQSLHYPFYAAKFIRTAGTRASDDETGRGQETGRRQETGHEQDETGRGQAAPLLYLLLRGQARRKQKKSLALANLFLGVALIGAVLSTLILSSPSHAAGTGHIYGQLLDGTKNKLPLAGQTVTLQVTQGGTARDLANVTTDTRGGYSFDGLDTNKTINYAVYIRYEGAQYFTGLIDLSNKASQQVNLTVYEATSSTTDLAIVEASVLLHKPDAQKHMFLVSEVFSFKNLGLSTYVGSLDASHGMPNALRFSLPAGARNVSLSSSFDGYQSIAVDRGFATDAAIPPGDTQFAFTFEVPYTTSTYDFSFTVVFPTVQLLLLVPPQIHVSSSALASQGLTSAQQDQYQFFQAKTLRPGDQLHVQLEGLPLAIPSSNGSAFNQEMLWLILALLGMLAVLAVTWFFYRSRRQPATTRRIKSANGREAEKVEKAGSQEPQQALLQELLELDKAFEAGKIKKAEYQEQRAKTKAQLRALMSTDTERKPIQSGGKGAS